MERLARLKRKCLVDAITFGGTALLMLAIAGSAYWYNSTSAEDLQKLKNEKNGLDSNRDQITGDLQSAEHAMVSYKKIQLNNPEEIYSLKREDLLKKLEEWQKDLFLSSLKANIEPVEIKPIDGVQIELRKHQAMQSNVKLEIEGLLDTHVWELLEKIRSKTNGFANINNFKIERSCALDKGTFVAIAQGAKPVCVKSVIDFQWIGLEEKKDPAANNQEAEGGSTPTPAGVEP